jgi:hypothetical protein
VKVHAKVYLCARTSMAALMEEYAAELRAAGHEVTSRWHSGALGSPRLELGDPELTNRTVANLVDLREADSIIAFAAANPARPGRGGRHFELGAAVGWGLRAYFVGKPEHPFHNLPGISRWQTWEHFRRGSRLFPVHART